MKHHFLRMALVLGLLSAVGPFAIDMYLPALPSIGLSLHADVHAVQLSLMAFFLSFALSQLVFGPASDILGRRGVPGLIVVKRLIMQGFIVMDFMDQRDAALADLQSWVASGQLKVQEDVIDGLQNTPQALIGLLAGENRGKRMIRL